MGKKESQKSDSNPSTKKGFHRDERIKFIAGVFIFLFSLYLLIALVSFVFTWKADQSFGWQNVFSASDIRVENWAGKAGAFLGNLFMSDGFGLAALVFPLIFGLGGLRLMKLRPYPFRKTSRILIVSVILASLVFGFLFGTAQGYMGNGLGGAHGVFVTKWLDSFLGKVGTAMLLLFATATFLVFTTKNGFHWLNRSVGFIHDLFKKKESDVVASENPEWANAVDTSITTAKNPIMGSTTVAKNGPDHDLREKDHSLEMEVISLGSKNDEISLTSKTTENHTKNFSEKVEENNIGITTSAQNTENLQNQVVDNFGEVELLVESATAEELANPHTGSQDVYDPTLDLSAFIKPPIELLEEYKGSEAAVSNEELISNKNKIVETLANYKIQIDKIKATIGPTVTLYEIVPAPGVRISKIKSLEDDIALNLAALGIRIIAPIPGKGTIGIEVPNLNPEVVSMLSIIKSAKFQESKYELPLALGKTISNETFVIDLTKMPHLLVAGATGQGKSVGLNAMLTSLLYKKHPSQLKFVLVDPKKVELTLYSKIERHFLAKLPDAEEAIITDTQKVIYTLNSLCNEMDSRYDLLKLAHVRNIKEYNEKFVSRRLNPEKGHKYLPYIVVVIDEFADLIMTAGREIETPIARLAQLARAIGIHLIIATQRPTTNIITGVIKANFPARIAFRVSAMVDSRTILDSPGANQLIGRGDMLVSTGSDLIRVQCAFVDTPEIERITDFIGNQRGYSSAFLLPEYKGEEGSESAEVDLSKKDELFEDAARVIVMNQQGSTSLIQRKFSIGYNRAGRIIDQLEAAGIVGPFEGSKARQVLITDEISLEQLFSNINNNIHR